MTKDTKSPDFDPYAGHSREQRKLRREVRYKLFRLKNEAETKVAKENGIREDYVKADVEKGFKKKFEEQEVFKVTGGFIDFGVKWDVDPEEPYTIISREKSVDSEWNEHLEETVKELPVAGETEDG